MKIGVFVVGSNKTVFLPPSCQLSTHSRLKFPIHVCPSPASCTRCCGDRAATEVEARRCFQTMERQTAERVALYACRTSPGEPLPINITPVPLPNGAPTNSEVCVAAGELSNGWSGGASKMRAEHVKEWLQGIQKEEDLS